MWWTNHSGFGTIFRHFSAVVIEEKCPWVYVTKYLYLWKRFCNKIGLALISLCRHNRQTHYWINPSDGWTHLCCITLRSNLWKKQENLLNYLFVIKFVPKRKRGKLRSGLSSAIHLLSYWLYFTHQCADDLSIAWKLEVYIFSNCEPD